MIEDTIETPMAAEPIAAISIEADVDDADHYDRDGETVRLLSAAGQIDAPETSSPSDEASADACEMDESREKDESRVEAKIRDGADTLATSSRPLASNEPQPASAEATFGDRRLEDLIETVQRSEAMLRRLLERDSNGSSDPSVDTASQSSTTPSDPATAQDGLDGVDGSAIDSIELQRLQAKLREAEATIGELEEQNESLASRVAGDSVRQTVGNDAAEPMSWEERKEAILRQMENDDFDSESFIRDLQQRTDSAEEADPVVLLDEVWSMSEKLRETCESQKEELSQLRRMMSERDASPVQNDATLARGAAAIAQMIDSDDLIAEERGRLEQLQKDWEEKFRKIEVETSLERAKLSRERQELAERLAEVETELAQTQRQNAVDDQAGGSSRRWLAKLGLEG